MMRGSPFLCNSAKCCAFSFWSIILLLKKPYRPHLSLVAEQPLFAPQATTIARQGTVRPDAAVTGYDNRDLVGAVGPSHRAHGLRAINFASDIAVGTRLAERNFKKPCPDLTLEGSA